MEKQVSSTRKRLKQQANEPWLCPECGGSLAYNFEKQGLFCERCREVREIQTLDRPGDPLPGEPEYLVPFSADLRECKSSIERYVKDAMFVPKSFLSDENLEKAQPYYVPYWSYTVTQSGKPQMQGVKVDQDQKRTEKCSVDFRLDAGYDSVLFDASEVIDDEMGSLLAPYRMTNRQEFHPAWLHGFHLLNADVKADVYEEDARNAANERTFECADGRSCDGGVVHLLKPNNMDYLFKTECKEVKQALLPVWLLVWRSKNRMTLTAVNGTTGKAAGDIPLDKRRFFLFCFLAAAALLGPLYLMFRYIGNDMVLFGVAIAALSAMEVSLEALNHIYIRETRAGDKGALSHISARLRPRPLARMGRIHISPAMQGILFTLVNFLVNGMLKAAGETVSMIATYYRFVLAGVLGGLVFNMIHDRALPQLRAMRDSRLYVLFFLLSLALAGAAVLIILLPSQVYYYYAVEASLTALSGVLLALVVRQIETLTTRPASNVFGEEE